jgi:hypothetical protein
MKRYSSLIRWCAFGALVAAGCGGQKNSLLQPNQPPEVELFAQKMGATGYRLQWVGRDPDGAIDHYLYALGSPAMDFRTAAWTSTTEREHLLGTSPRRAEPGRATIAAIEPSVFTVRAVDARGAQSTPARIAFFDSTLLAPRVHVVVPPANPLVRYYLPSTTCFGWEGVAYKPDGSETKVAQYKFKVLTDQTEVPVHVARMDPDSVRRYYAPRNWAGWDSTKGNVTNVVLKNFVPDLEYVFVITCFDDQGNYDPIFSFNTNMIYFRTVYAAAALPRIGAFNSTFFYEQPVGTFDPSKIVNLEVPAGQRIAFNWFATPASDIHGNLINGPIRGYRFALDLADVEDQRHGDPHGNSGHWTPWNVTTTSTTVGPFGGGETHTLYIEANADGCGTDSLVSLLSLRLHASQPSFDKELLIVDDTRLVLDRVNAGTACTATSNRPIGNWPTQAELDTFLYARGGAPWKCYPTGTLSTPGVFLGYSFDTIGTNLRIADLTVPLSTLGHYRHVLWLTDGAGALNTKPGTDTGDLGGPQTALRYMNQIGRQNTLATYVAQGGRVWLAGGGAATASIINFNRSINDNALPNPRTLTFRNADNELIPGRFMYDQAHWRSEFKLFKVNGGRIRRYLGRFESAAGIYAGLPEEIHLKSTATDPFPPNRAGQAQGVFYQTQFDIEFLSQPNEILEDQDPRRPHEDFQSTLDTLYKATGPALQPDTGPAALQSVVMTYYRGAENPPFVMTGFNLWNFRRADLVQLVDFVLQQLWGMTRSVPVAGPAEIGGADARRPYGRAARPGAATAPVAATGAARRE